MYYGIFKDVSEWFSINYKDIKNIEDAASIVKWGRTFENEEWFANIEKHKHNFGHLEVQKTTYKKSFFFFKVGNIFFST